MRRFKGHLNLHNSGLLLAGFLGMSRGSYEREIGCPEAAMSVSQFYVGKMGLYVVGSTVIQGEKTLF
jgi:hypothetical protein